MTALLRRQAAWPALASTGFGGHRDPKIRMPSPSPPWSALTLSLGLLVACGRSEPGPEVMPLPDGGSQVVPAACRVAESGQRPYQVTIRLRNTGQRAVFFANTYSCGVATTISSCAADHRDNLNELIFLCPCSGSCPVGGPGCSPAEVRVGPGEMQQFLWQASITIRGTRNGQECSERSQALPAGRYRVTAKIFGAPEHAIAGTPVLRVLEKDFEVPAPGGVVDVPFAIEEQPGSSDGGASPDGGACLPLDSIDDKYCPRTWTDALDAHVAFCAKEWRGGSGLFTANVSATACRGSLRYTRYLFDGGPRTCLYDPATLALRGYYAFDGKAMYQAITCGSSREDYDDKECKLVSCSDLPSALPACRWPSSLDSADSSTGACRAARALLSCPTSGGATAICASNQLSGCSSAISSTVPAPADGGAPGVCTNLCAPGEYAAFCGKVGPSPTPTPAPPTGCKDARPTPGGIIFYCCPCAP
jgi:hypothetical protein